MLVLLFLRARTNCWDLVMHLCSKQKKKLCSLSFPVFTLAWQSATQGVVSLASSNQTHYQMTLSPAGSRQSLGAAISGRSSALHLEFLISKHSSVPGNWASCFLKSSLGNWVNSVSYLALCQCNEATLCVCMGESVCVSIVSFLHVFIVSLLSD